MQAFQRYISSLALIPASVLSQHVSSLVESEDVLNGSQCCSSVLESEAVGLEGSLRAHSSLSISVSK